MNECWELGRGNEAGTSLPSPNLQSRCHQTIATLTDAKIVEKEGPAQAHVRGIKEGKASWKEALSKLKSNGQVEVRQQEQCVHRPGGKKRSTEL